MGLEAIVKPHVVIVGGGSSGFMVAYQIYKELSQTERDFNITILEKEDKVGGIPLLCGNVLRNSQELLGFYRDAKDGISETVGQREYESIIPRERSGLEFGILADTTDIFHKMLQEYASRNPHFGLELFLNTEVQAIEETSLSPEVGKFKVYSKQGEQEISYNADFVILAQGAKPRGFPNDEIEEYHGDNVVEFWPALNGDLNAYKNVDKLVVYGACQTSAYLATNAMKANEADIGVDKIIIVYRTVPPWRKFCSYEKDGIEVRENRFSGIREVQMNLLKEAQKKFKGSLEYIKCNELMKDLRTRLGGNSSGISARGWEPNPIYFIGRDVEGYLTHDQLNPGVIGVTPSTLWYPGKSEIIPELYPLGFAFPRKFHEGIKLPDADKIITKDVEGALVVSTDLTYADAKVIAKKILRECQTKTYK